MKKMKVGVCDMIKKSDRLMIFPVAVTNTHWLIVAAHVPPMLRRKAEKHGSEDIERYLLPAQEIIAGGFAAPQELPLAEVDCQTDDGYVYLSVAGCDRQACLDAKYLAYFVLALNAKTFYHNRDKKMVICYRADDFLGVIMEIMQY